MPDVDLSQLSVDRSGSSDGLRTRPHIATRYLLPGLLIFGFIVLVAWASWDMAFPPTAVRVIPVLATQADVRDEGTPLFNAAGWIEPRPTAIRVAALAPGVVQQLLVVEDQAVNAGDPVAELIKDDAQLVCERSKADRQLAEAELERARAVLVAATTRLEQPVHLQAMLAEADASMAKLNTMLKNLPFETQRAESQMNLSLRNYNRIVGAGVSVSEQEIDQARTEYETTKAQLEELQDRKDSLLRESSAIGNLREAMNIQLQLLADEIKAKDEAVASVKAAEARVQQMTVAEAEAKLRLERMTVRAPVSGRVYQLIGLPGARVGEGVMTAMAGHDGSSIITLYQPESLQIRVDVRFEDIPKVGLGQPVKIDNPALAQPISGRVLFISSEADIQKNTLQVKVEIQSPPEFFKPEMLVDVTFLSQKHRDTSREVKQELRLYVPQQFVGQFDGSRFVWLADQSAGVAHRQSVSSGAVGNGGLVEITGGLTPGSRIITAGIEGLKDGDRIRITGEDIVQ